MNTNNIKELENTLISAKFNILKPYDLVKRLTNKTIKNYKESYIALDKYINDLELAKIISYELGKSKIITEQKREQILKIISNRLEVENEY